MAEIKTLVRLQVNNGGYQELFNPAQVDIEQTTLAANSGIVIVGTSEEVLSTVDVTNKGVMILQNLDDTNYVEYGPESAGAMVAFGKIKPGEVALLRLTPAVTFRWQANTANVKMYYVLLAD